MCKVNDAKELAHDHARTKLRRGPVVGGRVRLDHRVRHDVRGPSRWKRGSIEFGGLPSVSTDGSSSTRCARRRHPGLRSSRPVCGVPGLQPALPSRLRLRRRRPGRGSLRRLPVLRRTWLSPPGADAATVRIDHSFRLFRWSRFPHGRVPQLFRHRRAARHESAGGESRAPHPTRPTPTTAMVASPEPSPIPKRRSLPS